jgi:hypothetical protein
MSFIVSTQAELLKTKRTASFWLSVIGAAFIPVILFIALLQDGNPDGAAKNIHRDPWTTFFSMGWQILSVFLLPMYVNYTNRIQEQHVEAGVQLSAIAGHYFLFQVCYHPCHDHFLFPVVQPVYDLFCFVSKPVPFATYFFGASY